MKKFFLTVSVLTLAILCFVGCNKQSKWSREERQAMRDLLHDYRQMVYLNDLTDAEYMLFADNVASAVEADYPVYTTFVEMPGANDTVQMYIVTTIVEELNTDARNMRHIFPYPYLVENNVLPAGLSRAQQNAFYNCLSQKVNNAFPNLTDFVGAVIASDTLANSQISQMQNGCANDLFNWTVEVVEVTD